MNHRFVTSTNALVLVMAFVLVITAPASAQIPGAVDPNWTAPRTPWGDPDL